MLSNNDYLELLKVVKENNCQIILAGDEKQLTSVERGGMFEVLANKFGSHVLTDIKRQSKNWSKEVARNFADDNVKSSLLLLKQHEGVKIDYTLEDSMSRLIKDWSQSKFHHMSVDYYSRNKE
ncbi:AAA domain protein [Orientia chuto str. Dubai]|uniref:AAA domain protein n=2 Tax=Candidatus Orientia mediorientalis TaxID=911112 RepID=A0A0F3MKX9_9RICK|nr:AAA domain protein [Orientia chuto str. Dubai]